MKKPMKSKIPDISADAEMSSIPWEGDSWQDYCTAPYTLLITVKDVTVEVEGWVLCGYIAPGASEDLDGSGLACWGDSQPGGWSSCAGDGTYDGTPQVVERDGILYVESYGGSSQALPGIPVWAIGNIQTVIDAEIPNAPEPSAEDLIGQLDEIGARDYLRQGNPWGMGPVLAWMCENGEWDHAYHPDEADVARAAEAIMDRVGAALVAEIAEDLA